MCGETARGSRKLGGTDTVYTRRVYAQTYCTNLHVGGMDMVHSRWQSTLVYTIDGAGTKYIAMWRGANIPTQGDKSTCRRQAPSSAEHVPSPPIGFGAQPMAWCAITFQI